MSQGNSAGKHTEGLTPVQSLIAATYHRSTATQRVLAFWLVPLILLLVGGLPEAIQSQWVLVLDRPTVGQLYLSNFVHADIQHLSGIILGYILVMGVLFPLAALSQQLRTVGVVSVLLLTVLPFIVSGYSINMLSGTAAKAAVGFSGVNAGFVGALSVFIGLFVRTRRCDFPVFAGGASLLGLELSVALAIAGVRRPSLLLLGGVSATGLGFIWVAGAGPATALVDYEQVALALAMLVFAVLPVTLLNPSGSGINVFGHLVGLVGGATISFIVVALRSVYQR